MYGGKLRQLERKSLTAEFETYLDHNQTTRPLHVYTNRADTKGHGPRPVAPPFPGQNPRRVLASENVEERELCSNQRELRHTSRLASTCRRRPIWPAALPQKRLAIAVVGIGRGKTLDIALVAMLQKPRLTPKVSRTTTYNKVYGTHLIVY